MAIDDNTRRHAESMDVDITGLTPEEAERKINEAIHEGIRQSVNNSATIEGKVKITPNMDRMGQINKFADTPFPNETRPSQHMTSPDNDSRRALSPDNDTQAPPSRPVMSNEERISSDIIDEEEEIVSPSSSVERGMMSSPSQGRPSTDNEVIVRRPASVGGRPMPHNAIPQNNVSLPSRETTSGGVPPVSDSGEGRKRPPREEGQNPEDDYVPDEDEIEGEADGEGEAEAEGTELKPKENEDNGDEEQAEEPEEEIDVLDEEPEEDGEDEPLEDDEDEDGEDEAVDEEEEAPEVAPAEGEAGGPRPYTAGPAAAVGTAALAASELGNNRGENEEKQPNQGEGDKGEDKPDEQKPDDQKPDGQKPEGQKPDGTKPDGQKQDGAKNGTAGQQQRKPTERGEGRPNQPNNAGGRQASGGGNQVRPHNGMPQQTGNNGTKPPSNAQAKPVQNMRRNIGEGGAEGQKGTGLVKKQFGRNRTASADKTKTRRPSLLNRTGGRARSGLGGLGKQKEERAAAKLENARIKRERKKKKIRLLMKILPYLIIIGLITIGLTAVILLAVAAYAKQEGSITDVDFSDIDDTAYVERYDDITQKFLF